MAGSKGKGSKDSSKGNKSGSILGKITWDLLTGKRGSKKGWSNPGRND